MPVYGRGPQRDVQGLIDCHVWNRHILQLFQETPRGRVAARMSSFQVPTSKTTSSKERVSAFAPVGASEAECLIAEEEERAHAPVLLKPVHSDYSCPPRVSKDLWERTFPYDRGRIRRRAAWLFRTGLSADAAILRAERDIIREEVMDCPRSKGRYDALIAAWGSEDIPEATLDCLLAAATAVPVTASSHAEAIVQADNPKHAAWKSRCWHARPGRCLITGQPLPERAAVYQGDGIHPDAEQAFVAVASTFAELVVEEAQRLIAEDQASASAYDVYYDDVDPDDASTWILPDDAEPDLVVSKPGMPLAEGGFLDGL